jgi:glyoxylase-like metal-dependent hydrolase (beta-lactamase superfamily II)
MAVKVYDSIVNISYTQLNIGCLSRNKFWGEPQDAPKRAAVCTSTLIELPGGAFLLVDPGLEYEKLREAVFNRRGVSIEKITDIFLTHFHGDHLVDLDMYAQCRIYASEQEIAANPHGLPSRVRPWDAGSFVGISIVPLPGHTPGSAGLSFISDGLRTLVAGDAVMTKDFFLAGEGFHNTQDENALKESLRRAGQEFDVIVPGHDVQFFTGIV